MGNFQAQYEMLLLKVDSLGNVISAKQYGQNNYNYEFSSSIIRTTDNAFVLAGYIHKIPSSVTSGVYLVKLNNVFDTLWTRSIYDSMYGSNYHYNTLIKQADDNGFIIAGSSATFYNSGNPQYDSSGIFLVKTDSLGFPIWSKRYGEFGTAVGEMAENVFQTTDLGYIIAGNTSGVGTFIPNSNNIYLIKTDSFGNTDNCFELPSNFTSYSQYTVILPLSVSKTTLTFTSLSNQFIINSHTVMDSLLCVLVSIPEDNNAPSNIQCYPNPFSDYSIIQYPSSDNNNEKVLVFDFTGRLVREKECSKGECKLEKENLKPGMYIFRIMNQDNIIGSGKIIVE